MTLFTLVLVFAVTLTVLWNVVLVEDYQTLRDLTADTGTFHWTFIAVGSALFLATIVLLILLGTRLITQIRWSQRQTNFIASVSHELNSPLSSIKLFAQTLRQDGLGPADRANFVGKILFDVERLNRIIANILRAAEIDNRGAELPVALQAMDLVAYLRDYLADARVVHGAKLDAELAAEGVMRVEVDPMMFRQVLDNLFDNAVRYRGSKPARVRCSLARSIGWVRLEVADEGVGIPRDQLGQLFERFSRIEQNAPQEGRRGMGIGLFVVRSIVQGHGGRVHALSDGPGRGTRIAIELPAPAGEAAA